MVRSGEHERVRPIQFLLGDRLVRLADADPGMTVLEWLRGPAGLRGTKEGCAEGDCGACTVAIGECGTDGQVQYRPANACIQFLPSLDGRQLLTVEHLSPGLGQLHPVQSAMVAAHASQCGFCTPGFVMMLFTLYRAWRADGIQPDRQRIDDGLAGNLCRCTGYGPIVQAAEMMMAEADTAAEAPPTAGSDVIVDTLTALAVAPPLDIVGRGKRWLAPRHLQAALDLVADLPDAVIVAGATDVGLWVTKQHRSLATVISVSEVAELRAMTVTDEAVTIGAAVTYAEAHQTLERLWPDFGEVIRRIGSVQIRSSATIGGNLANGSPIGDTAPILIALGATITLSSRARGARTIPVEEFFLSYGHQDRQAGELLTAITIPRRRDAGWGLHASKVSKRFDQDITAVLGAFHLRLIDGWVDEVRVAYGGMAGTPARARAVETALMGRPWTEETVDLAAARLVDDFSPMTDWRGTAAYRMTVAGNLLRRAWIETASPGTPTRLSGSAAGLLDHGPGPGGGR